MSSSLGAISLTDLQRLVGADLIRVDEEMRRMVRNDFALIRDVNQHLLRMRGKLFRPTLALLSAHATGTISSESATMAAVLELIHLATLVHDDSVDHSALRRGMPTVNALFSHQVAVIMGDFLYSRAMVELTRFGSLDAMRVAARVTNEMTIGEMRQLLAYDPLMFTEEQYHLLIGAKTASLMSGACEIGALNAPASQRAALARYGDKLGRAFQITDDLLDYTADETTTGKPSGLDLREHKVTLPLIHALPRLSATEHQVVLSLMDAPEPSDALIAEVIGIVSNRGGLEYALVQARRLATEAEAELASLPESEARDALRASIHYVMERRS